MKANMNTFTASHILTKLRVKRVALVPKGANFDHDTGDGAHILLRKTATDREAASLRTAAREGLDVLTGLEQRQSGCSSAEAVERVTKGGLGRALYDIYARATAAGIYDEPLPRDEEEPSIAKTAKYDLHRKIETRIRQLTAGPKGLSRAEAEERVFADDPQLYREYRRLATA